MRIMQGGVAGERQPRWHGTGVGCGYRGPGERARRRGAHKPHFGGPEPADHRAGGGGGRRARGGGLARGE
eukprot:7383259-Pyramimonas_sp.AAC.2